MLGESPAARLKRRAEELREDHFDERPDQVLEAVNRALGGMPLYERLGYPAKVTTLAALARLPVLEKKTLRTARPSELLPASAAASDLELSTTSGSEPIAVWAKRGDAQMAPAGAYTMLGVEPATLYHTLLWTSPVCSGGACEIGTRDGLTLLTPTTDVFAETDAYFEAVVAQMTAAPPGLLLTNPVMLCVLLRWLETRGRRLPALGGIVSSYQKLSRAQRVFIRARTDAALIDQYGASELAGCIVTNTCTHGTPHVWARRCRVEVIDSAHEPVAMGTIGSVVLTNIGTHGTCVVRYRVGDVGRLRHVACACGVVSSALDVLGRSSAAWHYHGELVTEDRVDALLSTIPGILFWQLWVRPHERAVLTLVADGERPSVSALRDALVGTICDDLAVRYSDRVRADDSQKYPAIQCARTTG